MPHDFDSLLKRAQEGSKEAFDIFIDLAYVSIFNFFYGRLGNRESAEDETQEFFLKVWNYRHRYRGATAKAWLFRIALNHSRNVARDLRRHTLPQVPLDERITTPLTDPYPGSQEYLDTFVSLLDIQKALSHLPMPLRDIVLLHYFSGLTLDEIAETLNLTYGAVFARLRKARRLLRDLLPPPEPSP